MVYLDDVWEGIVSSSGLLDIIIGRPSVLIVRLTGMRTDGGRGGMAGLGDSAWSDRREDMLCRGVWS